MSRDDPKKERPTAVGATPLAAMPDIERHGDEPMTEAQEIRLRALAEKTGETFDGALTRRQAAQRIAALEELAR